MIKSGHFRTILLSQGLYPSHIWGSIDIDGTLLFSYTLIAYSIALKSLTTLILLRLNTRLTRSDGAHVLVVALAMRPDLDSASVPLLYW